MRLIYTSIIFAFFITAGSLSAQQIPNLSLAQWEPYYFNPACATSTPNAVDISFNTRKLYSSFQDGQLINYLSVQAPLRTLHLIIGAKIMNDYFKPVNFTSILGTIGYKFERPAFTLSIAADIGILNRALNYGGFIKTDQQDKVLDNNNYLWGFSTVPDFNFGVHFKYKQTFYAGLSLMHGAPFIFGNNLDYKRAIYNSLSRVYHFRTGYLYQINNNFSIEPFFISRMMETGVFQFDGGLVGNWRKMLSLGVYYRLNSSIVPMIEISPINSLKISYGFESYVNGFGTYAGYSHEFMVKYSVKLNKLVRVIEVDPRYY